MSYIEIDGSQGEGGGQIVRTAMSLATIFQKPIHITKIRAGRKEPGLRPQHLQSVLCAARLCNGKLKGASVGSTEIVYEPAKTTESFSEPIDTGTAGSISLIAQTIIPISIFCGIKMGMEIRGGTEVSNSPTIDYLDRLVLPVYKKLGASISIQIERRGYYPRGGGIIKLNCHPGNQVPGIKFETGKSEGRINILSVSRGLPRHVSERQLESARNALMSEGKHEILSELDYTGNSFCPGTSVLVYRADSQCLVGGSSLGERGKRAESVGEEAAKMYLREIAAYPNVDSHLADMLVTLLSCTKGESQFTAPTITEHFKTNSAVARQITGCEITYGEKNGLWVVRVAKH